MPRPTFTPWGGWNETGFENFPKSPLTFAEVNAIKQVHQTGRFSKASIMRMYDIRRDVIDRVLAGTYRYRREA
jgi:hypothetical protein